MTTGGWLLSAALCAAAFMPALGARTRGARRWLLVAGSVVGLIIGSLAIRAAMQPGEGFFPSDAGWAFILVGLPLGAGMAAAGLILVLTRFSGLSEKVRAGLAIAALLGAPVALLWRVVG